MSESFLSSSFTRGNTFLWGKDRRLTLFYSDPSDPKKQTEQILAIYPILTGQKSSSDNPIPPRQNVFTEPAAAPASKEALKNDLIEFGQNDVPTEPPKPANPQVESTGEISGLLKETGTHTEGPLIDFHNDLKKNVPVVRKSDTTGSNEVFVDAEQ